MNEKPPNRRVSERSGKGNTGGKDEYRLHVVMDRESFEQLTELKNDLEAASEAEVVRRALKAYEGPLKASEICEPIDTSSEGVTLAPNQENLPTGAVDSLYVRISARMKERLDMEYNASGLTYSAQVRQALRVFSKKTEELRELLSQGSKEALDKAAKSEAAVW